jgi:chemotaxis protein methyltransferase WspC
MTPKRTIDSPQPGPERARGIEASPEMVGRKGLDGVLSRWIGLDATTLGSASLTHAYQRRLEASGLQDLESLQTLVECDSRERDLLVEEVVVSESWFFRDEQTFSFLEAFVRLILDTGRRRPVRILSIPCACGEEPYSIAMRLFDAGIRPDAFCIDAFDVSRTCLKRAALGHYSANAFRNADQSFRRRWFREEGSHSVIDPVIRSQVQFAWGNLLDRDFAAGQAPYDVIFCRNLLIYLTADARRHVAESLDRLLAADGALVLGAAEPPILGGRWMPTGSSSMFALRRRSATENESGRFPCTAEPADLPQRLPSPVQKPSARPPLRTSSPLSPRSSVPIGGHAANDTGHNLQTELAGLLEKAGALANNGRHSEAIRLCEEHARNAGPSPTLFYLLGSLYQATGNLDRAEGCFHKTLYLDPLHEEAALALALVAGSRGDERMAESYRETATRIFTRKASR